MVRITLCEAVRFHHADVHPDGNTAFTRRTPHSSHTECEQPFLHPLRRIQVLDDQGTRPDQARPLPEP
ncbi:hypothetical protein GCM10022206_08730 [Streptomyces chiangmaiensis]